MHGRLKKQSESHVWLWVSKGHSGNWRCGLICWAMLGNHATAQPWMEWLKAGVGEADEILSTNKGCWPTHWLKNTKTCKGSHPTERGRGKKGGYKLDQHIWQWSQKPWDIQPLSYFSAWCCSGASECWGKPEFRKQDVKGLLYTLYSPEHFLVLCMLIQERSMQHWLSPLAFL